MSLPRWCSEDPIESDGIYGDITKSAVWTYQDSMSLRPDGVVGSVTGTALGIWRDVEEGFDASHWNTISWDKIPDYIKFVNLKATEGVDYTDPDFISNVAQAQDRGLSVGAYHFTKFRNPPVMEAANFLTQTVGLGIEYAYLDLEYRSSGLSSETIAAWISQFMQTLKAFYDASKVGIYTSKNYLSEVRLQPFLELSQYKLWAADWTNQPFVYPWELWQTWQYTSNASVEWADAPIDMNRRICKKD